MHYTFFFNFIIKSFKKIFINYFIIGYIIIYTTIRILNIMDKVDNSMEFRMVKH